MKCKTITLYCILLAIVGCKQPVNKKENTINSQTEVVQSEDFSDNLKNWAESINNNDINAIKNLYDPNGVKIISSDSILENSAQIADYYMIRKGSITLAESIFTVEANKERGINYELVRYTRDNRKEFVGIVIWSMENERIIREFEFTEEYTPESKKIDTTNIAQRRNLWVELCNTNNPENLVKQLYSNNTMYFNHKPIVQGTEALIREYGYMNNENYELNLHPMKLEVVNASTAFEIGQCSGSYNGKYILVWKKQTDGNWKVFIDSNI